MFLMQDGVLEGLQLEISERPTTKQLEDLRKQVKILQVMILIKKMMATLLINII